MDRRRFFNMLGLGGAGLVAVLSTKKYFFLSGIWRPVSPVLITLESSIMKQWCSRSKSMQPQGIALLTTRPEMALLQVGDKLEKIAGVKEFGLSLEPVPQGYWTVTHIERNLYMEELNS
jgi:hypothetical protein